ncbi:MAG: hypothetical protein EBX81_05850 [bacterium]|nr:hypothetical protein [Candidatus Aquidulcis sp.]
MKRPPLAPPLSPLIRRAIWIYAFLALFMAIAANILRVWILEQEATFVGALIACGGQVDLLRELHLPPENQRRFRIAFGAFLFLGGITLQIAQSLYHRP